MHSGLAKGEEGVKRGKKKTEHWHLLPELSDRGGEVSGVGSSQQCLVLAQGVFHAVLSVPWLVTLGPGQLRLEALEQVVEAPGQDHNVVDVEQGDDHNGGVADTCVKK